MKKIIPLFLFFLLAASIMAQTERAVVQFEAHERNETSFYHHDFTAYRASMAADLPLVQPEPFIAYSIIWESTNWEDVKHFRITFSDGKTAWDPVDIEPDAHAKPHPGRFVSELYFAEKTATDFRIEFVGKVPLENIEVHFFSPGKTSPAPTAHSPQPLGIRAACPCPLPAYLDRNGWCPDGTCPPDATPVNTTVTHLIVHHSAGSNTSSDWAATVRSIWDFHVNVNGWDDIGYNFLIDPNGVLYEGRGNNRLGAHFCGQNGATTGVCMLGDFTATVPTPAAYDKLEAFLAWKSCDIDADPLGSSLHTSSGLDLPHIAGHRDGCNTACPGAAFYPTLTGVRSNVATLIANDCNGVSIAAPSNLQAEATGFTSVELTWTDNSDDEDNFVLERSKSFNNNYVTLATLPANTTAYSDLAVQSSTGYFYRVQTVQAGVNSPYSNEVFVATAFSATDDASLGGGSVRIFPNPARETTTVSVDNQWVGTLSAGLYDALGRQVAETFLIEKNSGEVKFELPLGGLPAGIFYVKILQEGNGSGMFKLVKR